MVLSAFYKDDLYHSTDTIKKAISKDLKSLIGGFILTKYSSNSPEAMKSIALEDQNPNNKEESKMLPHIPKHGKIDKQLSATEIERVLGIQSSVSRDSSVIYRKRN